MRILNNVLTPLALTVISGLMVYDHMPHPVRVAAPRPAPSPSMAPNDGEVLGRAFAPVLVGGYADAWVTAAGEVEAGKSIPDAQLALQGAWKAARVKAFARDVQPVFSRVLPEGTEPADAAQRARVVELWRSFARGLKGGR